MRRVERIVVSGAGLIGGSVALGLRRAGWAPPIVAFEPSHTRAAEARATGAFECVHGRGLEAADVADGDLVVLAAPVGAIVATLETLGELSGRRVVVTDAGSTKRTIVAAARGLGGRFVGGHPMAGSEQAGASAARGDLFDGAAWALAGEDGEAMSRVVEMVEALGAVPVRVSADEHDREAARFSHAPQVVAYALSNVAPAGASTWAAGKGHASMTRLAASPWSVWRDVFEANADAIAVPLDELIAELARLREGLRSSRTWNR